MATQLLFPNQPPQFLTAPSYLLGRGADCDILLPESDAGISRHHARLERDDSGDWWLSDSSTNGTRVNERKLDARHRLRDGDRIGIGAVSFSVSAPQSVPVAAVRALEIAPVEAPRSSPTTLTPRAQLEESLAAIETPAAPAAIVPVSAPAPSAPAPVAQIIEAEIVAPIYAPSIAPAPPATPPQSRSFEPDDAVAPLQYTPPQYSAPAPQSAPPQSPLIPAHNPYAVPQSAPPYQQPTVPAPAPVSHVVHHAPPPSMAIRKSPGMALLCSIFWGGGHFYNGQFGKGLGFVASAIVLVPMALMLGWIPFVGWSLWMMVFGCRLWDIIDAYNSAERINRDIAQHEYNQQMQNQINQAQYNAQLPR